jgi:segregation and condensation protein B
MEPLLEPMQDQETPDNPPDSPAITPEQAAGTEQPAAPPEQPAMTMDDLLPAETAPPVPLEDAQLQAVLEAVVYVAEEPLTLAQLSAAFQQPVERIRGLLQQLMAEFEKPEHGIAIREVAGGFKMATKAEHHEAVRNFVRSLKPPLKLSLPALETLAVIAYKQPVTGPEIQEIRGVQGTGVLKTLLDRKLIAAAGRKNVIGKPILYKTTREFLVQFGLKDLSELPSLKEFEEIRRMALTDDDPQPPAEAAQEPPAAEPNGAEPGSAEPAPSPEETEVEPAAASQPSPETGEAEQASASQSPPEEQPSPSQPEAPGPGPVEES